MCRVWVLHIVNWEDDICHSYLNMSGEIISLSAFIVINIVKRRLSIDSSVPLSYWGVIWELVNRYKLKSIYSCYRYWHWLCFVQDGYTALIRASSNGHYEVVDALLRAGAKVNMKNKVNFHTNTYWLRCCSKLVIVMFIWHESYLNYIIHIFHPIIMSH